jgi:three-Cys-motif partner protein
MTTNNFFEETTEQSLVKATIVSKYFWAWANVILPTAKKMSNKIAYIDLFAGPGRYKDGTKSTPILVLERAIQEPAIRETIICMFNDKDSDNSSSLEKAIDKLPGIEKLKHKPVVYNEEVGSQIVKMFEEMNLVPTLFFVDPWGYKGLSLKLVNSVLKDWGCDCIFFFNYNRINMGLNNPFFVDHMNSLFGEDRADNLRSKLDGVKPAKREIMILEELIKALSALGGKYVLPFRFKDSNGKKTSHHLIFVSKSFKGYEIMKGIMAKESSRAHQGVPSFEYNVVDKKYRFLFELTRPLDDLADMLLSNFRGQTLTMEEIYMKHNIGTPFIKTNYKDILKKLEQSGKITADPSAEARRKNTFADTVKVKFPRRG